MSLSESSDATKNPALLVRKAVLVHEGSFMCSDGAIEFSQERIKNVVRNHNSMIKKLARDYGGLESMPVGAFPPILNGHDDDDNDKIVGRLNNLLKYEELDIPGVGKKVPCATTSITFLGENTVNKVNDGRIYHLSIGIDEETDTLGETSTVVVPAAPGAMLLSKQTNSKDRGMSMSKKAERVKQLSALKAELTTLGGKMKTSSNLLKLEGRKSKITHRLTGLMRAGKVTPAEYKKMDLTKLAAMDDASLDASLSLLDAMEPKILPGQRGSTAAVDFSTLADGMKKSQIKRLKAETYSDMGLKRLSGSFADEAKKDMGAPEKEVEGPAKGMDSNLKMAMDEMKKHLESGNVEGAKASMKKMEDAKGGDEKELSGPAVQSEESEKETASMQEQVDNLQMMMAKVMDTVSHMIVEDESEDQTQELDPAQAPAHPQDPAKPAQPAQPPVPPKKQMSEDPAQQQMSQEEEDKKKLADAHPKQEKELSAEEEEKKKKLEADKEDLRKQMGFPSKEKQPEGEK
jgi:soluble cytochrome b562